MQKNKVFGVITLERITRKMFTRKSRVLQEAEKNAFPRKFTALVMKKKRKNETVPVTQTRTHRASTHRLFVFHGLV